MPKRLTFEYIKSKIEKEHGYRLISKKYMGSKEKLEVCCPEGHLYSVSWGHFQNGTRCPECSGIKKLTYGYVKNYVESFDYKIISSEYKNSKSNLEVCCDRGHFYSVKWYNFQTGKRCSICAHKRNGDKRRLSYKYIKEYIEAFGFILKSNTYIDSSTKLNVICPEGHSYSVAWNDFQSGYRCLECSGKKRLSPEFIKRVVEERGYSFPSQKYKNTLTKLKIKCLEHGIFEMTWSNFGRGVGCPSCAERGFNPNKPAIFYYLEVKHRGRVYYKIGITNRTVEKRYPNSDISKIAVLFEKSYENGGDAHDEEQRIRQEFGEYLYRGDAVILEGAPGNAELFTEDVLGLTSD